MDAVSTGRCGAPEAGRFQSMDRSHLLRHAADQPHEHRRHLFKTLLSDAWRFSNWLTHAKGSTWHDAEAALTTVEHALSLAASLVIRHVRGVPEACPAVRLD